MSFQAYLDNIYKKTGKTPADFHALAKKARLFPDLTASQLVVWLKKDFDLGHGHAMAIWAVFKSEGWVGDEAKRPASAKKAEKTK